MQTSQSVDFSLGVESFISPIKYGKMETSANTLQTLPSFQFSETNVSLPVGPSIKTFNSSAFEKLRFQQQKLQSVPQIAQDLNQIVTLQKWVLMYYQDYQIGKQRLMINNMLIEEQKKLNKQKIRVIKDIKQDAQRNREIKRKLANKKKVREKYEIQTIEDEIYQARAHMQDLKEQIHEMELAMIKKKSRKTRKSVSANNIHKKKQPIYVMSRNQSPRGFGPYFHPYPQHNIYNQQQAHHDPRYLQKNIIHGQNMPQLTPLNLRSLKHPPNLRHIQQQQIKNYMKPKPPRKKTATFGTLEDLIMNTVNKRLSGGNDQILISNSSNQSVRRSTKEDKMKKKASQVSIKWENDGEEKDVLQILEKSNQSKKANATKSNLLSPKLNYDQSGIAIIMEQSMASSFDRKKKPPSKLYESAINIDIIEDDSNSKSQEISIEQQKTTRKKSNTFQAQKSPSPHSQNVTSLKNSINAENHKPPMVSSKHRQQKRKSGDVQVKDVVLDGDNLKRSQAGDYFVPQKQSISFKGSIMRKEEEDDEDDWNSIQLLTVSKISKEKQLSEKASKSFEKEQQDQNRVSKSTIIKRGNQNSPMKKKSHKKMQSIQEEDEENLKSKQQRQRRRKMSGTRYSLEMVDSDKK